MNDYLAAKGIRRLLQTNRPQLGHHPVVIYLGQNYSVLPVERSLSGLGLTARQGLHPLLCPQAQPR